LLVLGNNVLLNFQPHERIEEPRIFYRALAPGGLFAAERTQEMPSEMAALFRRLIPDGQRLCKVEAEWLMSPKPQPCERSRVDPGMNAAAGAQPERDQDLAPATAK
jgi:hypothetical protein